MRSTLVVALLGLGLFSAGLTGVGQVNEQVAAADRAAKQAERLPVADCPYRDRDGGREPAAREL